MKSMGIASTDDGRVSEARPPHEPNRRAGVSPAQRRRRQLGPDAVRPGQARRLPFVLERADQSGNLLLALCATFALFIHPLRAAEDPGEMRDLAAREPVIASRINAFLKTARSESADWPVRLVAALAQNSRAQRQRAVVSKAKPRVLIETSQGRIEVELDADAAPITVSNFLRSVAKGLYSDGLFHRTVTLSNQPANKVKIEVIQAAANSAKSNEFLPPIELERTRDIGLKHRDGTISMARAGADTAQDEFFICIGDQPELDFGGKRNPDGQGFAVFGKVVKGMDVVRQIQAASAVGQKLTPPIRIQQAMRMN